MTGVAQEEHCHTMGRKNGSEVTGWAVPTMTKESIGNMCDEQSRSGLVATNQKRGPDGDTSLPVERGVQTT
jgi:hypothetical protein